MINSKKGNLIRYGILVIALLVYNVWLIINEEFGYRDDFGSAGQWSYYLSFLPFFTAYGIVSFLIVRKVIIPNLLLLAFEFVTTEFFLQLPGYWRYVFVSVIFSFVAFLIYKILTRKKHN